MNGITVKFPARTKVLESELAKLRVMILEMHIEIEAAPITSGALRRFVVTLVDTVANLELALAELRPAAT